LFANKIEKKSAISGIFNTRLNGKSAQLRGNKQQKLLCTNVLESHKLAKQKVNEMIKQ
jgi:hypothetical protein